LKTTTLIIEWLIGGILVSLALVVLAVSFFPRETQGILAWFTARQSPAAYEALLATIVTAIVYAVGILSEFVGRALFEPLLDKIKQERFKQYLQAHQAKLSKSETLKEWGTAPPDMISTSRASACLGEMRFEVLMKSPELYGEIEREMNQFRLIRVLFLVEAMLGVAIARQLLQGFSVFLTCSLVFVIVLACVTWLAVRSRFHRYCRAIERTYKVLVLDPRPEPRAISRRKHLT
jgi:hypothetical protein